MCLSLIVLWHVKDIYSQEAVGGLYIELVSFCVAVKVVKASNDELQTRVE